MSEELTTATTYEATAVAVAPTSPASVPVKRTLFNLEPKDMVEYATELANVLSNVVKKQGLAVNIGGARDYVRAEGWSTLGSLLGVLPKEAWVKEHEDGSFEAHVELVKADGTVVGGASALCSTTERAWKTREKFARRSMAITRATGKAYRLAFGWIMTLAGYEATPAEEMELFYQGTDTQKAVLFKVFKNRKFDDAEIMRKISQVCMGLPMSHIEKYVEGLLDLAPEGCRIVDVRPKQQQPQDENGETTQCI